MLVLVEKETIELMQQTAQQDDPIQYMRTTYRYGMYYASSGSSSVVMDASFDTVKRLNLVGSVLLFYSGPLTPT